ncbi:MAG: hypothetical protein COU29_00120 [Candidatus Magasanikbacteria bacterium CG10_big_fil_rev_8_21_14_0_10_36_32]|uniref:Uncharacterized protein n=1 Tax=Candidatus Magasanikbacteria bacterium CG10_big_fil_rev_8_21_14_0_10_36_32 TaxID=1974646 RepID=A0A2M6W7L4_9BACT|nr:MAG: hypothetical protein COU29_00120 [Candidatus Magasanikbacteria bacterium CG10_big_fil_rev_8_21_14_0_10_36_32]
MSNVASALLLGLAVCSLAFLFIFLIVKLVDFSLQCVSQKIPKTTYDHHSWWYELVDDYRLVKNQITRWHWRWYINPNGIFSISRSNGLIGSCQQAIYECLEIIHQLQTLENAAIWRQFHCGKYDFYTESDDDWIAKIKTDRIQMENWLKDLKQKETQILTRLTEEDLCDNDFEEEFLLR